MTYLSDVKTNRRQPNAEDRGKTMNQLHNDIWEGINNRKEKMRKLEEEISSLGYDDGTQVGDEGAAGGRSDLAATRAGSSHPSRRVNRR
jgi:hypothetical protein